MVIDMNPLRIDREDIFAMAVAVILGSVTIAAHDHIGDNPIHIEQRCHHEITIKGDEIRKSPQKDLAVVVFDASLPLGVQQCIRYEVEKWKDGMGRTYRAVFREDYQL